MVVSQLRQFKPAPSPDLRTKPVRRRTWLAGKNFRIINFCERLERSEAIERLERLERVFIHS